MTYKDVIDCSRVKTKAAEKRMILKYVCEDSGIRQVLLSQITTNKTIPMSENIAKLCFALKVKPSEIVEFKDIKPNKVQEEWFENHTLNYEPGTDAKGELTYAPFWELLERFLESVNEGQEVKKNIGDILDTIKPACERNASTAGVEAALKARGITKSYEPKKRKRVEKGLSQDVRTKLKNDRPVSLRTIYDICKKLGCSIDWVLSYK